MQPDGSVDYTASGSTFLYMGSFGGVQPQQVGGRMFTNSRGEFFLRVGRPRHATVTVLPTEFLLPGRWEVVSAPAQAVAAPEQETKATEVILRQAAAEHK